MKIISAILLVGMFASCALPQVHVHDQHGQDSAIVEAFARSHPGATLVLFDRHHDIASTASGISSSNWVAATLERELVAGIVWVPAAALLPLQRTAREERLHQGIERSEPDDAVAIEARVSRTWTSCAASVLTVP